MGLLWVIFVLLPLTLSLGHSQSVHHHPNSHSYGAKNSDVNSLELGQVSSVKGTVPNKSALTSDTSCNFGGPQSHPYFRPTGYKFRGSSYLLKFENSLG